MGTLDLALGPSADNNSITVNTGQEKGYSSNFFRNEIIVQLFWPEQFYRLKERGILNRSISFDEKSKNLETIENSSKDL